MAKTLRMSPTKKDRPWLDHPTPLENWVNTSCDEAFSGANIRYPVNPFPSEAILCVITYMHDRYHEGDMQNQDGDLNLGQCSAVDGVDEDGNEDEAPEQQCLVPQLRYVVGIVQRDQGEDLVVSEVAASGEDDLPAADYQPAYSDLLVQGQVEKRLRL